MSEAGKAFYRPITPEKKKSLRRSIERQPDLTATERRLLSVIFGSHYRPKTGACITTAAVLARELGLSRRHIDRLVRGLAPRGYLDFQSRGARREEDRWQPGWLRFRPGSMFSFCLDDVHRKSPAKVHQHPPKSQGTCQVQRQCVAETGPAGVQQRLLSQPPIPAGEPARRARPAGESHPSSQPQSRSSESRPSSANQPTGFASRLTPVPVPTLAAKETRATKGGKRSSAKQLGLFEKAPINLVLSELEIRARLEHEPDWLERHPPGSEVSFGGQRLLVPAYHPDVLIEDDEEVLAHLHTRGTALVSALVGERWELLSRVRQVFSTLDDRLIRPGFAVELARAAFIVARLEGKNPMAPPPHLGPRVPRRLRPSRDRKARSLREIDAERRRHLEYREQAGDMIEATCGRRADGQPTRVSSGG